MKLLVVESPTKCKTIGKFLGPKYKVVSSYGHMRDLPKDKFGLDVKHNFKPDYVIIPKAKKNVAILKKEAEKAELIILALDGDREGEAIAWHLSKILELDKGKPYQRIVFHEITKEAIKKALKNPRKIDLNLVDAQQARRILDRIVGYRLSPFLWKKISRGLSAGRVQSVVVRLVADREKEIGKFKAQEYWSIIAYLPFEASLNKKDNKAIPKLGIKNKKEADRIVKDLKGAEYKVAKIDRREVKRNPLPPFITSTLQQEAYKKFRFPAKLTMGVAQGLYEKGLTTYHRTDSVNLSDSSLFAAKKFIFEKYGENYWAGFLRKYKTKSKRAQEAHEAIRPSYPTKTPETVKTTAKLDEKQFKLYNLIWSRFIACQMSEAIFDSTILDIEAAKYNFRASGRILKFDGFLKVYPMKFEQAELPALQKDEILKLVKLSPLQHSTQPPARYTEASLIKALEENGIGRPSTYAPIISVVQARNYIEKNESKRFQPTEIGTVVDNILVKHFPKIVDIKFTAEMEEDLDEIARGKKKWVPAVQEFYNPFMKNLDKKTKEIKKMVVQTKEKCDKCGKAMVERIGRYGKFLACSGFPNCKNTKTLARKSLGLKCEECKEGDVVEKRTRAGKKFWGCSRWPDCEYASWEDPTEKQ